MIKFVAKDTKLIGFGLSQANIKKLKQGLPILVDMKELGFETDHKIFIFYGKTEEDMLTDLKDHGFINDKTQLEGLSG